MLGASFPVRPLCPRKVFQTYVISTARAPARLLSIARAPRAPSTKHCLCLRVRACVPLPCISTFFMRRHGPPMKTLPSKRSRSAPQPTTSLSSTASDHFLYPLPLLLLCNSAVLRRLLAPALIKPRHCPTAMPPPEPPSVHRVCSFVIT